MIDVKNLDKHFEDLVVLKRYSVDIKRRCLSIIGPSGSGSHFLDV